MKINSIFNKFNFGSNYKYCILRNNSKEHGYQSILKISILFMRRFFFIDTESSKRNENNI